MKNPFTPIDWNSEQGLFKNCPKFQHSIRSNQPVQRALIFCKLNNLGTDKKQALKFCQKKICKFDCTQKIDGPVSNRCLRSQTHKEHQIVQGWQNIEEINYKLENKYKSAANLVPHNNFNEVHDKFDKLDKKIKNDFKHRIQMLQAYFKDVNEKSNLNFQKNNRPVFRQQLKTFHENYRKHRATAIKFTNINGIRYFEIINHFEKDDNQYLDNPVNKLKAFEQLLPDNIEIKERFPDDLFENKQKTQRLIQQEQFKQTEQENEEILEFVEQELYDSNLANRVHTQNIVSQNKEYQEQFNSNNYLFSTNNDEKFEQHQFEIKKNFQLSLQRFIKEKLNWQEKDIQIRDDNIKKMFKKFNKEDNEQTKEERKNKLLTKQIILKTQNKANMK